MKTDSQEVYMNLSGDVLIEHMEFLRNKLLGSLQYGYRRIVMNMNDVRNFDRKGLGMLSDVRYQVLKNGGELIIEDKNGVVSELV